MTINDQFSLKILFLVSCLSLVTTLTSLLPAQILAVVAATVVVYAAAMSNAKGFISGNLTGSLSSFSIWMLPIAATAALIGIYVWILSFGPISFNEVKSVYILLTGIVCTFATFRPLFFGSILGDLFCVVFIIIVSAQIYYNSCGTIFLTAVFSYQAIRRVPISSFQNAFLLCFFMFLMELCEFSEMSVSDIADSFSPSLGGSKVFEKISLFGKTLHWKNNHDGFHSFALKDIVLPGLFVSQMLRFDLFNADNKRVLGGYKDAQLWTPYFYASFICLVGGFSLHNVVSTMENKTLPIFLFMFPSCICTTVLFSIARREFAPLMKFADDGSSMNDRAKNM